VEVRRRMMKTVAIYESLYGNTEAIAEAIAEGVGAISAVRHMEV